MATESYGRCDDGVHWAVYHELPLGQWWWMIHPDGGERIDSPQRYATEKQALAAVEAARAAAVAGRPVVETMESLRARAEAAEARAAQTEADARALLGVVYGVGLDMGLAIVEDMYDHGMSEDEDRMCNSLAEECAIDDSGALLAVVRRILAAGGAA